MVRLVLPFSLLVPFLLPHMHERYFFAAHVLAVVYAVAVPRRWRVLVLGDTASLFSYVPFLYRVPPAVPFPLLTLLMAVALVTVLVGVIPEAATEPWTGALLAWHGRRAGRTLTPSSGTAGCLAPWSSAGPALSQAARGP